MINGARVIKGAAWLAAAGVVGIAVAVVVSVRRDIDSATDVREGLVFVVVLLLLAAVLGTAAALVSVPRTMVVGRRLLQVLVLPAVLGPPLVSAFLALALADHFREEWYAHGGRIVGGLALLAGIFAGGWWASQHLVRSGGGQGAPGSAETGARSPSVPTAVRVPLTAAASVLVAAAVLAGAFPFILLPLWALEEAVGGTPGSNERAYRERVTPYPIAEGEAVLRRLAAGIPTPAEVVPQACPDGEIVGSADRGQTVSWLGTLVLLPQVFDPSITWRAPVGPRRGDEDAWKWASSEAVQRIEDAANARESGDDYGRALGEIARRRYVAWAKASRLARPRPIADGEEVAGGTRRRLAAGTQFSPGVFEGGLFVVDVRSAAVVCQVPLEVTSSAFVEHATREASAATRQAALDDDFRARFRDGERAALRRISLVLRVAR